MGVHNGRSEDSASLAASKLNLLAASPLVVAKGGRPVQ